MPFVLRLPKFQLTLTLILIFLTTFKAFPVSQTLSLLVTSLISCVLFDLLFVFLRKRTAFVPYAAIATSLIIALIIDPDAKWYQIALVSAVAMATKNFIRISDRHIFNPAAAGLFIGGVIFGQYVSWWGVSFQNLREFSLLSILTFIILLSPILVSGYRMRRITAIVTFLVFYTAISHIFTFDLSLSSVINRLTDPTILFFALVMLPEPMTSPLNPKRQLLYGLSVASVAQLLAYPPLSSTLTEKGLLPGILILALLFGNLIFFKFK